METKFVISEVLKKSWECTKSQLGILIGLWIGFLILGTLLGFTSIALRDSIVGMFIYVIASMAFSFAFILGYIKNIFQALDGMEPQFSAYSQQAHKIVPFFAASLIACVIVSIGFVFLIIPGFYLYYRLMFFPAFIIEEDAGAIESLKKSWEITRGQVLPLFTLSLVMCGICLLGYILLIVGVFIAIPLIYMMYAETFRRLNVPPTVIEEL
ncbi:hypothetical protein [Parabacteroides sp. PF5-9]|uniref:hypothetical protein n=1 Tax=Parabacteroides sp. PF5-9 TaxID=1742404 RepID=UPI0024730AFB|nr:hypothetical protein [Parabacteroides sp. PF5-9]MDH6359059.1 membrane-anchored glycerophosphoryl diester phosphodiesterase (GDPDase) [Parabacteroides sp. PF5-9]